MLIDNFQPQAKGTYSLTTPTTGNQVCKLPDGAESIAIYNGGSADVRVEFGADNGVTVVIPVAGLPGTAGSYPIRAGAKELIRLPKINDLFATWMAFQIDSGTFTGLFQITRGSGS